MSTQIPTPKDTPESDAIRKLAMQGHWSITEKGGFLEYLESFERQRDEARKDAERLAALVEQWREELNESCGGRGRIAGLGITQALDAHEALTTKTTQP